MFNGHVVRPISGGWLYETDSADGERVVVYNLVIFISSDEDIGSLQRTGMRLI